MAARTAIARTLKPASSLRALGGRSLRSAIAIGPVCLDRSATALPTARHAAWPPSFNAAVRNLNTSSEAPPHMKGKRWGEKGAIAYPELKKLAEQPTGEVTVIDVREPDEVAAGMIPSAVSVPLSEFVSAFNSKGGGGDFQSKYSFPRPDFDHPLVFYCRSGKRSAEAQKIAASNGWKNSRNYEGSWLDWVSKQEKNDD